jgi:hypothetical protein
MYRFICTSYKIKLGQTWFQDQRNWCYISENWTATMV